MPEAPRKRWTLPRAAPPQEWETLGRDLGIPGPGLAVLWNRGLRSREEILRFLDPSANDLEDPYLLTDMECAVGRIRRALDSGETILCLGDYDVDGITAAALWARVLRGLGAACVETMIPNRMEDGFGLTPRAAERARSQGAKLLIASDCGTTAHAAAARAAELGVDLIVSDHHIPGDTLPPVHALVNPRRPGDRYPFPDLAAVGVSFKIVQALCASMGPDAVRLGMEQLDLVALGTVADVVPLRGENRILVTLGLQSLRNPRPAFRALIERAGLDGRCLDENHMAYFLAPRLNASGRLGMPGRALELLLAEDPESARQLASVLEDHNRERRRLNERVQEDAARILQHAQTWTGAGPIVLGSADWHPGVLGIAASRLAEQYWVPVVLVALGGGIARGSARTPPGVDLLALVAAAREHLSSFGGHRQAVGLSLEPDRFEGFRSAFLQASAVRSDAKPAETVYLDGELDPCACDLALVRFLARLGPFGSGNEEPLFRGRTLCHSARVEQGRHLRLRAGPGRGGADCVGFGMGARAADIPSNGAVLELIYHPVLNRYRGEDRVQLKIREFRLGGPAGTAFADGAEEGFDL